jgi:hypothetical protein
MGRAERQLRASRSIYRKPIFYAMQGTITKVYERRKGKKRRKKEEK